MDEAALPWKKLCFIQGSSTVAVCLAPRPIWSTGLSRRSAASRRMRVFHAKEGRYPGLMDTSLYLRRARLRYTPFGYVARPGVVRAAVFMPARFVNCIRT